MDIKEININLIKNYERNAKKHDKRQIKNVAESIKQFGFVQPIVIDKDGVIIIGHCRYAAALMLKMPAVPCVRVETLTKEQVNKLRLLDNKLNESEWDKALLLEDIPTLDFTGFDIDWGLDFDTEPGITVRHGSLYEDFVVPPFSVLDARQGRWQDRKAAWRDFGIKSEIGRDAECLPESICGNKYNRKARPLISIFDPVLCEIMYLWFCPKGGIIYDCFAGGSVRGIVADKLGYKYIGIDIRQEQIDVNYSNARELELSPVWYCDDSLNVDKYIEDQSVDMLFTCPPYGDLEKYSDNPNDISNMSYDDFCEAYRGIIDKACNKLKQDRFAVFVVGDIRDKTGAYRNFVDYTKQCFNQNGLVTYNEAILLDQVGTGAIRARQCFKNRKLIKTHQNVLIFYKGDIKHIKDNFDDIEVNYNLEEV